MFLLLEVNIDLRSEAKYLGKRAHWNTQPTINCCALLQVQRIFFILVYLDLLNDKFIQYWEMNWEPKRALKLFGFFFFQCINN